MPLNSALFVTVNFAVPSLVMAPSESSFRLLAVLVPTSLVASSSRISTAAAELKGGDDDFEEYYCPTIEWNWGDGTVSESTNDCDPYEAGKSQIRRRFTVSHNYRRSGAFRISFRLKNKDKVLASSTTIVRLLGGAF